jgi:RND family efflux transporter MFP subunit
MGRCAARDGRVTRRSEAALPQPGPNLKRLWLAVPILAAAAGLTWWQAPVQVQTALPTRGDAAEVVYATGTVEPRQWAKVSALVRKRIVELCDCEGKPVTKGQVLARLDDLEERAVLTELQARRDRFQEDVNRLKGLVERNVASRVAYDDKLTQVREYDARILAQKERLDDLVLKAPVDGIVLRKDGQVGEIAGTGTTDVLFWVGQPKPLRVTAEVNEEDIAKVKPGQRVLLRHEGFRDTTLEARVDELTPKGDPATKTFRAYFLLPDDTPLKIGMSVEANVVVREVRGALLVPADAVRDGKVQSIEDGRIRRVTVKIGIKGARTVEILSGVAADQTVLSPARPELADRTRVAGQPAADKR